jgi:polyamine oxidase
MQDYVLLAHPQRRGYFAVWQDLEPHRKLFPESANMLLVTVVQADSVRVEEQTEAETIREVRGVTTMMYGVADAPLGIFVPRWSSDRAFRGSWSNIAVGAGAADFDAMRRPLGSLYFAGEATDATYNGFTLGGYTSGLRAARSVLAAAAAGLPCTPAVIRMCGRCPLSDRSADSSE